MDKSCDAPWVLSEVKILEECAFEAINHPRSLPVSLHSEGGRAYRGQRAYPGEKRARSSSQRALRRAGLPSYPRREPHVWA